MDQAVLKALREKKELERRLAEIEQFLRLYRQFSGESVGNVENEPPAESTHNSTPSIERAFDFIRHGPKAVKEVSAGILQDVGQPLTRGELVTELELRRVRLPGKDKESRARYVGTVLWRHRDLFENIEGRGYWLRGVAIPETEDERRELRNSKTL
jgi:hypothetical protein